MEQDSDNFVMDIKIHQKSAFMLLSFQDRVIKLRNYFRKEEYPFLGMSKEKKRDFRRLAKQFSLDKEDSFTILKKTRITRSEYINFFVCLYVCMYVCMSLQTNVIISYRLFCVYLIMRNYRHYE